MHDSKPDFHKLIDMKSYYSAFNYICFLVYFQYLTFVDASLAYLNPAVVVELADCRADEFQCTDGSCMRRFISCCVIQFPIVTNVRICMIEVII